jgi:hypothetical protein
VCEDICRQIRKAENRRNEIKVDIGIIVTLINDPRLFTTFDEEFLSPVLAALNTILRPEFSIEIQNLQTTTEALGVHRARLLQSRAWIQDEMQRWGEEENRDRGGRRRARLGRFLGPSPNGRVT